MAAVKSLPAGAGAGYGLAFVAQRPTQVAVLTIGYGDGLPRSLTGGEVLLGGRRAPIIGRICMDQTLVDVTDLPARPARGRGHSDRLCRPGDHHGL
ncbi:MAG: alanine racemase C-terminal domain-containing protein [Evtepia gabavorous]